MYLCFHFDWKITLFRQTIQKVQIHKSDSCFFAVWYLSFDEFMYLQFENCVPQDSPFWERNAEQNINIQAARKPLRLKQGYQTPLSRPQKYFEANGKNILQENTS